MNRPPRRPADLRHSLPALAAHEAEVILSFIEQLSALLWDVYGRDASDLEPDDEPFGEELDDVPW